MRLLSYLAPLMAWVVSWTLTFGLPLAALWLLADALPGAIPIPNLIASLIADVLEALDLDSWAVTAIPLPEPGTIAVLARLLAIISAAFLALLLFSHALSPMRPLIRLHGRTARIPKSSRLYAGLAEVAEHCGRKMPPLWVVESNALNARALAAPGGRQAVLLTTGLIQSVTDEELRWVFAHELAHLYYGDAAGTGLWLASQRWSAAAHRMRLNILNRVLRAAGRMPLIWAIAPFLAVFCRIFVAAADVLERIALAVLVLLSRSASRHAEFRADAYAATHVGSQAGIAVLHRLCVGGRSPLPDLVGTHPSADRRIEQLRTESSKNPI